MIGLYKDIPHAGKNVLELPAEEQEEQNRRLDLVKRLDKYEMSYMTQYEKTPDAKDACVHYMALLDSGLTEHGLSQARAFAGKKCSFKSGVFIPIKYYANNNNSTLS